LATVRTRLDEWTAKRADLDGAWVAAGLQPRPRHREQFFVRSVLAVSLTEAGLPRDKFLPAESFVQLAEALSLDRKE
jgi:hypothetical protein